MQWIHGGAWFVGENSKYNGSSLAEKYGVIVVAANYRLDVLGWLALAELEAEGSSSHGYGNIGLLDQQFALAWTQRNIHAFGGDAGAVTVFGQSAGAFSVCQHFVMPASNGLFSHAAMESGDCDGPWLIADGVDAKAFGSSYASFAGCPPGSNRTACLRSLPVSDLLTPYSDWFCKLQKLRNSSNDDPWCVNKSFTKEVCTTCLPSTVLPSTNTELCVNNSVLV
jgi:para-nitrobenzyl esterase